MAQVADTEWMAYKEKFNKFYDSEEDKMRRALYARSKAIIEAHNKKYENGEVSWQMGINHLSDYTDEEYKMICGTKVPHHQ